MCLVFIAVNRHADYPLIVAANRDEFYDRPTKPLHRWPAHEGITLYAGQDERMGGTWMGVTDQGRFAIVTNVRETHAFTGTLSRGQLPLDWLYSDISATEFGEQLHTHAADYAAYNCVFGSLNTPQPELFHISNRGSDKITPLTQGVWGLSNAHLDTPWYKVTHGKSRLAPLLQTPLIPQQWIAAMSSHTQAPVDQLPNTGVDPALEQHLSSMFIQMPDYGTRCTSLLTTDHAGNVRIIEHTYDAPIKNRCFSFPYQRLTCP